MQRIRSLLSIATPACCALALAWPGLAPSAESPARFHGEAVVQPLAVSIDGRYSATAAARFVAQAQSADGRFALSASKTPSVDCDANVDPIFGDGFETLNAIATTNPSNEATP